MVRGDGGSHVSECPKKYLTWPDKKLTILFKFLEFYICKCSHAMLHLVLKTVLQGRCYTDL